MMPSPVYSFPQRVGYKVLALLAQKNAMLHATGKVFRVYDLGDRVLVSFKTDAVDLKKINEEFGHYLSTRLDGRRVVRTNSRGLFMQVSYDIPPARLLNTVPQPLDLGQQPTPYHIPVGVTADGPLWLSLPDANGILVAGSRGMGKSGAVHGMIQALLHGGQVEIYADDGATAMEFGRYADNPHFHYMANFRRDLEKLSSQLAARMGTLRQSGYTNVLTHNASGQERLPLIALVVDEITLLDDDIKETLKRMIQLYRKVGLYAIVATNEPLKAAFEGKSQLTTRICFHVPQHQDSSAALGYVGAEKLPAPQAGEPGRGLILWNGSLTEFQAFRVPNIGREVDLTEAQRHALEDLFAEAEPEAAQTPRSEIEALAESIRERYQPGMSGSRVAELLGKTYGGGWYPKIKKIIEYLSSTSTENAYT